MANNFMVCHRLVHNQNYIKLILITGNAQFVATVPVYYLIWIAIDNNGKMYALSTNDRHIYTINKQTGAATALPQCI